MIVRIHIKCNHCESVIMLRIGVGSKNREPFQLACDNCSQQINATLVTDQAKGNIIDIELTGAIQTDEQDYSQLFTYHPHFVTPDIGTPEERLSPFIAAFTRYENEDDLFKRTQRLVSFEQLSDEYISELGRLIRNYKDKDWGNFTNGLEKHIPKGLPLNNQIDYDIAIFYLTEDSLSPIIHSENNIDIMNFIGDYISSIQAASSETFSLLLTELDSANYLSEILNESLELLANFHKISAEFRSVIIEWNPDDPNQTFPSSTHVTGKVGFDDIKSLYVDGYELICRSITIIISLINLDIRGNSSIFPHHPTNNPNRPFASGISSFHQKPNAPKKDILFENPQFHTLISESLDSKLRNAIGHNTIKYDPKNGNITYPIDRTGTIQTISYGQFLFSILRLVTRSHQVRFMILVLFRFLYQSNSPKSTT